MPGAARGRGRPGRHTPRLRVRSRFPGCRTPGRGASRAEGGGGRGARGQSARAHPGSDELSGQCGIRTSHPPTAMTRSQCDSGPALGLLLSQPDAARVAAQPLLSAADRSRAAGEQAARARQGPGPRARSLRWPSPPGTQGAATSWHSRPGARRARHRAGRGSVTDHGNPPRL